MLKPILAFALLAGTQCNAATVYLCEAYDHSNTFWTAAPCSTMRGVMIGSEDVPPTEWPTQVAAAEAARQGHPPPPAAHLIGLPDDPKRCQWLDDHIRSLDATAREGQSLGMQIWIAEQRKNDRDEQFRRHC